MIVQEVFGFVKRDGPGEVVRSEAEEVRRGLGLPTICQVFLKSVCALLGAKRGPFPSSTIVSERSSQSRVRFAALEEQRALDCSGPL